MNSQNANLPPENLDYELRQMELATARELPVGTTLPAETALLRDGFLAFGQVLEAAAEPSTPARVLPRMIPRNAPLLGTLAALAASLVVGALAWQAWQPAAPKKVAPGEEHVVRENAAPPSTPANSSPNAPAPAVTPQVATLPPGKENTPVTPALPATSADDSSELAWDDSFDNAITEASERLWTIRHNSFRGDGVYTSFSGSLERIGQELQDDAL